MAKKKLKTLREQREERIRKFKEMSEQRFEKYRDRLTKVRTPGKKWSILDGETFFVCGYCSYRMALYSPRSVQVNEEDPMLFYGCGRRCEPSNIHRVEFVDNKLIDHIYERLVEKFPNAEPSERDIDELLRSFSKIDELEEERRKRMELLPHAGYNRDELVQELIEIEEKIDQIRMENSGLETDDPSSSPLLSPVFSSEKPEDLYSMNLSYRTELVKAIVKRIRFFNETLIVKMKPLDKKERSLNKAGGGRITNIHLAYHYKGYKSGDETIDDEDQTEPGETKKRPEWERVDPEFIMAEPEETSRFVKSKEKVDIDLVSTEPGSAEEKEILGKKQSPPDDGDDGDKK